MKLSECKTRQEVEKAFELKGISADNFEAKNVFLLEEMGSPQMFYSIGNPSDEQKYEMILASFLSRKWEYAKILKMAKIEGSI